MDDPLYIVDLYDRVVRANRAFFQFTGLTPEQVTGKEVASIMHPHGQAEQCLVCQARVQRRDAFIVREAEDPTNSTGRPIETTIRVIRDHLGHPSGTLVRYHDLTSRRQKEEALHLRNRAIEASTNAIVITNCAESGNPIAYVNPAFERITGYAASEVEGRDPAFLHRDDRDQPELEKIRIAIQEQREGHAVLRNYRKDGSLYWNDLHIAPVRDRSGTITHFIGIQNDITDSKHYQEELEFQANHDTLTGLANRNLFYDRMQQAMIYAQRHGAQLAVAFLDLDQFKFINDSLGHNAGDHLLKVMADRLKSCVREGDTVARLGGDEFVILINEPGEAESVANLMYRMLEAVAKPVVIAEHESTVTCSAGISIYPHDGHDIDVLIKHADIALFRAKEQGRNNVQFFISEMNARIAERVSMERSLRQALERQEFLLHYQPQMDLNTGQVVGVEALVRWQHPGLGLVPPLRFIPLAEDTGLIVPIGEWVLRTACAQTKAWHDAGFPAINVSVNFSARQFRQNDLVGTISRILQDTGLDAHFLDVELTESLVMLNADEFINTLNALKALGVQISIDDFGTGYSSLSYLRRFPIDRLKLDRSFVRDVHTNSHDAAIAKTVIMLGHSLNLKVVGEGAETEEHLAFLRDNHCDEVQGFYISHPVPAAEVPTILLHYSDGHSK